MKTDRVVYRVNPAIGSTELGELFASSGIRRPYDDPERLGRMLSGATLVIGAYCADELVGVARALTDFSYCCYLSCLAVRAEWQGQGIGKALIEQVGHEAGSEAMLLLMASPEAVDYYRKIGLEQSERCFWVPRER